jgi:predicted DNA-binding transcriptional regulator AlpA
LGIEPTAEFVGRSVPEIRRLIRLGLFPKPLKLNGRRLSWRIGDLIDWIDSKAEQQKETA